MSTSLKLNELVGHKQTKKSIFIEMQAAEKLNSSLPHMLFAGSPGCGKTSMAKAIAKELDTQFLSLHPDALEKHEDTIKLLETLNHEGYDEKGNRVATIKPTILFIDEIHNLNLNAQEVLGIAMEEFRIPSEHPNKFYWIPYFTLIGATTDEGKLSHPFVDRMGIKFLFEPYTIEESAEIVRVHANLDHINITNKAIRSIAKRGRGIPRYLVKYLQRVRSYAEASEIPFIISGTVRKVFEDLGIDEEGLGPSEIKLLKTLYEINDAVGLENLAIILNEASKTIAQSIEPFLIRKGLIIRTGKGRKLTQKGVEYVENKGKGPKKLKKIEIDANYHRA
jgi:holliday junction DNA helicase RuvB